MSTVVKTANGHLTSLLIQQQVPEFVVADHPKFVTFIEKYYEFMANNTLMATSANSDVYYYGADTGTKILQDIRDVDKTDFDQFVEKFRRQYGFSFPQSIYPDANRATLYKNMVNFYQSVGTEDAFKMLFRLLYNEEIEIYYPKRDLLIASGGNYIQQSRIRVNYVDNINHIENKLIVGANSGAFGTVERVEVVPAGRDTFISGKVSNSSITYLSGTTDYLSNNAIHEQEKSLERTAKYAYVVMTSQSGNFELYEELYYSEGGVANTTLVANTNILPVLKRTIMQENFSRYNEANNFVSLYDGKFPNREKSTNPPWGSANVVSIGAANTIDAGHYISYTNTGFWHTTGSGTGQIQIISNSASVSVGERVLRIGNNSVGTATGDLRHFVYSVPIPVNLDGQIYRLTFRARDVGGNSAYSVAAGNRFSAGIIPMRKDGRIISDTGYVGNYANAMLDTYETPYWLVSHKQSLDDNFYEYTAYFNGLVKDRSKQIGYVSSNYGNGGRKDLPSGQRNYNSLARTLNREVLLPRETAYILPTFKVNEPANGASFSQGITEIDYILFDEITTTQRQQGYGVGAYRDETSLLSGSSRLYDGHYWQQYAYDIRSKQQLKDYSTVVREAAHPSGFKMFGTKISESSANASIKFSNNNITDTFLPSQLDSLAGWWRADAIHPQNIQYKRWSPKATSNGNFGDSKNRLPVSLASFEDRSVNYANVQYWGTLGMDVGRVEISRSTSEESTSRSPLAGDRVLKITQDHHDVGGVAFLGSSKYEAHVELLDEIVDIAKGSSTVVPDRMSNESDYSFPIVLEPKKKWLLSAYMTTSNTTTDVSINCPQPYIRPSNSSGLILSEGYYAEGDGFSNFSQENSWERKSAIFDLTSNSSTRYSLGLSIPDSTSFTQATGNTFFLIDGLMLEEYIPEVHGTSAPYTPSSYVSPGMSGANVISWFDQSPNKHHVYANTHGGIFYTPQYIANAVGGKPAIRFSANTVKNNSNVYTFSSIGGTANSDALYYGDATNFKPPTSGLQSKLVSNSAGGYMGGTLASNSLPRSVANTWTIMAVVKTNLGVNATSYDTTLHPTIFNSGYAGNEDALSDSGSASGTLNLGYDVVGETGAVQVNVVNSTAGLQSMNTATVTTFGSLASPNTASSFRIVGVSVNASLLSSSSTEDLLNFHIDGRRFANSEINNFGVSGFTGAYNFSQNNHVTSIGKWKPGNSSVTTSNPVASVYEYGAADWDGDIAEILVFNEKLSNSNIAKVEGYLAHKYSLQENLKHKDDDGNGGPEVEAYRWEFANTTDGWEIPDRVTVGYVWENADANGYIELTAASGSALNMVINNTPDFAIDGAAYDKFGIRFINVASYTPQTPRGIFTWVTVDGIETSLTEQGLAFGEGWKEHYVDLSGQSNWTSKKIKTLSYKLDEDSDGGQKYYIDWIYVSGNNHPHPYRYNAPLAIGANSWNRSY